MASSESNNSGSSNSISDNNNSSSSSSSIDTSKWMIIYPAYVNSNLTVVQGRRIPKEKAVANPSVQQLAAVCRSLGFQTVEEPTKGYSRDILEPGRIRVLIKNEKQPINPEITTKRALLCKIGELAPNFRLKPVVAVVETGKKKKKGKK